MPSQLSRLEARMEALVEGTFARLFAGRLNPRDVALQLARALEDSAATGAPATRYVVRLNREDADALLSTHPDLAQLLARELLDLAREAQVTLPEPPEVVLQPEPGRKPHSLVIAAERAPAKAGATQALTPMRPVSPPPVPRAFVILDGERTVALTQPVVSLGRRFDNSIILDDSRVSRAHAQLRLRFGRYVVYDLGSTGGTFVNGRRVDECVLRPGDVISLGGVPIIYGEDTAEPSDSGPVRRDTLGTRPITRPLDPPPESEPPGHSKPR
jgi:pSer/pThr/pTyr-binding forkhead associated (FHA) protein